MESTMNPAEILNAWFSKYEQNLRKLECVSAYLDIRLQVLEESSSGTYTNERGSMGKDLLGPFME